MLEAAVHNSLANPRIGESSSSSRRRVPSDSRAALIAAATERRLAQRRGVTTIDMPDSDFENDSEAADSDDSESDAPLKSKGKGKGRAKVKKEPTWGATPTSVKAAMTLADLRRMRKEERTKCSRQRPRTNRLNRISLGRCSRIRHRAKVVPVFEVRPPVAEHLQGCSVITRFMGRGQQSRNGQRLKCAQTRTRLTQPSKSVITVELPASMMKLVMPVGWRVTYQILSVHDVRVTYRPVVEVVEREGVALRCVALARRT